MYDPAQAKYEYATLTKSILQIAETKQEERKQWIDTKKTHKPQDKNNKFFLHPPFLWHVY